MNAPGGHTGSGSSAGSLRAMVRLLRRNCRRVVQSMAVGSPTPAWLAMHRALRCTEKLWLLVGTEGDPADRLDIEFARLQRLLRTAWRSKDVRVLHDHILPSLYDLEELLHTCPEKS